MTTKRFNSTPTGPSLQSQIVFNENSCSDKTSESGHDYTILLGALNTVKTIPIYRPVLIVNLDVAIQYVALSNMGTTTIAAAPTGAVRVAGVTTITTTTSHGYFVNQAVLIAGVADVAFNGTFVITSVTDTTFTYAQALGDAVSGGGTASMGVPASAVSGIPIPAGGRIILASATNTEIVASSANVYGYIGFDNIQANMV